MGIPATEMVSFMAMVFPRSFPLGAPTMLHRQYLQCNSDLCIMQLNCQDMYISSRDTSREHQQFTLCHTMHRNPRQSWILASIPWIPDPKCWILDSLSLKQSLEGFWIPSVVFPIPKPRNPDSTAKTYWFSIPQAKISWILESGLSPTWGDLYEMRIFLKNFCTP